MSIIFSKENYNNLTIEQKRVYHILNATIDTFLNNYDLEEKTVDKNVKV